MKKTYKIEVDCAGCALKMENAAKKTDGVKDAAVSFMTQRLTIDFCEGVDTDSVMTAVANNCKKATSDGEIYL